MEATDGIWSCSTMLSLSMNSPWKQDNTIVIKDDSAIAMSSSKNCASYEIHSCLIAISAAYYRSVPLSLKLRKLMEKKSLLHIPGNKIRCMATDIMDEEDDSPPPRELPEHGHPSLISEMADTRTQKHLPAPQPQSEPQSKPHVSPLHLYSAK